MSNNIFKEIIIDRRSSKEVSKQISAQLEPRLLTSQFIDGDIIINHKDLAEILKLDEKDVLDAYLELEKKEFLDLSDIEAPILTKASRKLNLFDRVVYIEEEIKASGKEPSVEVIDFEVVSLDDHELIDLDEFKNKKFLKQVRVYKANGQPYVYLIEYFPVERFPNLIDIDKKSIDITGNIYKDLFYNEYGVQFKKLQRYMNVVSYEGELSNIFEVKDKTLGFKIGLIYYDQDMIPFCYGNAYMSPNLFFDHKSKE